MTGLSIKPLKYSYSVAGIERLIREIDADFQLVVDKSLQDIKRLSQWKVPVDQGVAKASHYVVTEDINERDDAIAEAEQLAATEEGEYGHKGRKVKFDYVEVDCPHNHGFICVAVVYGLELEFGYISGSLNVRAKNPGAARPFLTPSVMEYEETFFAACRAVFNKYK